jgi:ankyrin repeat protein
MFSFFAGKSGYVEATQYILSTITSASISVAEKQRLVGLVDEKGDTALHHGARGGWVKPLEAILSLPANARPHVDVRNLLDETPLLVAAKGGSGAEHLVTSAALLASGADPNARDRTGRTPVIEAIGAGAEALVLMLVEDYGARLDVADGAEGFRMPPISKAISLGRSALARRLLDVWHARAPQSCLPSSDGIGGGGGAGGAGITGRAGELLGMVDARGWSPLHWAVATLDVELVTAILTLVGPAAATAEMGKSVRDETPLDLALRPGRERVRQAMAACGVKGLALQDSPAPMVPSPKFDPDSLSPASFRSSPDSGRIGGGQYGVVPASLGSARAAGAAALSPQTDVGGSSYRPSEKEQQYRTSIEALIKTHGVDILSALDSDGAGVLHHAATAGFAGILKWLLEDAGPGWVELPDLQGRTPLHHACGSGRSLAAVEILARLGARLDARDKQGKTPLSYALRAPRPGEGLETARFLLRHRARADLRDDHGATPLAEACANGDVDAAMLLVNEGNVRPLEFAPSSVRPAGSHWTSLASASGGGAAAGVSAPVTCLLYGHADLFETLVDRALASGPLSQLDEFDARGYNLFHWVCLLGQRRAGEFLRRSLDARGKEGREVLKQCLERRSTRNQSPMELAVREGHGALFAGVF